MKIGVFVHSQSGNTARFGLAITHALREKNQDVDVELLRPLGKVRPRARHIEFRTLPEIEEYDVLLFGGPIWAFSASPVLLSLFNRLPSLKGKKTLCFTTSALPPSFSEKKAQNRMRDSLESLGATVLPGVSLFWGLWCGKKKLDAAVDKVISTVLAGS
jgi:NAD(P)H dehydrogenase (quinone)